jgi:hypothetical protein
MREKLSDMARYRKIDTRMWGDSKFRELSSPQPSGKYLWMFLLTGPQTSNIPGLFHAGEMALSEELEWSVEAFREAFEEASGKGLVRADWKARVVWVPNAVKYNQPESPNVVKSWRYAWDEIPECALKVEAHERLKVSMKDLGEGFAKAFAEACAQPSPNQEQEQEQEQEQKPSVADATVADDSDPVDPRHAPVRALIQQLHLKAFRVKCQWDGSEGKALDRLLSANPSWTEEQISQMVRNRFGSDDIPPDRPRKWMANIGSYAAGPQDRYNKLKGGGSNGSLTENRAGRRQTANLAARETARAEVMAG